MSNWTYLKAMEDLAVWFLLFALLTACVTRWRSKKRAVGVSAGLALVILGSYAAATIFFYRICVNAVVDYRGWVALSGGMMVVLLIGFIWMARKGWRPTGADSRPAAAAWPRLRLVLATVVALMLNAVTYWNLQLAVLQRLTTAEVEAKAMLLSTMTGRPIDSHNAAVLYTPVFDRLEQAEFYGSPKDQTHSDKPLDIEDPKVRKRLAAHQNELKMLRKAAERSHCFFQVSVPVNGPFHEIRLEGLIQLKKAADILAADTHVKLAEGEQDGALANTIALFRMARHAEQELFLISALASTTIEAEGIRCLEALLNQDDLSADQLAALQLEGDVDYRSILQRAFITEEAATISFAKTAAEQGIDFISMITGGDDPDPLESFMWAMGYPFFIEQELTTMRSRHREMRAALALPGPQVLEQLYEVRMRARTDVLLGALAPALDKAARAVMIRDTRYRLARIAVAMRQYELDHGALPETFDALAPTYLDLVPVDPTTEEPFQMVQIEDGLRLYSAGVEAMDLHVGKGQMQVLVEMVLEENKAQ